MQSFGDLKPGKITRRPLSLDKAQDGLVQLKQTPAQRGDQLEITYTVKTKSKSPEAAPDAEDPVEPQDPEESEDEREYRASTLLDVRTFGFYTTLKSQILFYNRLNDGSSTFSAAPGISYNLHYLPESNQECWDAIAPGFGLSVSAPNFENGTELALGAQLTFINDMIQTGMAYNLSVDDDHWMYYVGFDLIGVFQAID
jgi:hypothetical protein